MPPGYSPGQTYIAESVITKILTLGQSNTTFNRVNLSPVRGDPNGQLDGGIGDLAIQSDAPALWQKSTATGDSGWMVVAGSGTVADLFYLDASDFGMLPNSADASIGLNAAIAAANAAGGRSSVYIPAGSYTMLQTVQHLSNVIVFGTGPNTVLRFAAGVSPAWNFAKTFTRSELYNLQIIGSAASPAAVGISLDQSQRCFIHDMQIWYFQVGILLSSGLVFSGYNDIGPNVEINVMTDAGLRAYANANGNRMVSSRIFFCFNASDTAIGIDVQDAQGLEIDDVAVEACDFCTRVRNTNGLLHFNIHDCYLEPGINPTTATIGSLGDINVDSLFDGTEGVYGRNNVMSGQRANIVLPPEGLVEWDGFSSAYYGGRFHGASQAKRNYVYNGELLYYGLPSVLPGWAAGGAPPPTLSASGTYVTGNRSLLAVANATDSVVSCGFTVSDEGVAWVTCGIRYQIVAGNVGVLFAGTVGGNQRQLVPEPLPAGVWRTAYINVPVDPTNNAGAVSVVVDNVNGNGSILIDEVWAVAGKYASSSTQYGERLQLLPAPIPILSRTGVVANETFGPIDILTLPSTLAPPLDTFCTAPDGVVGALLRLQIQTDPGSAAALAAQHTIYVDIPPSGTVVAPSNEFLTSIFGQTPLSHEVTVRDTTISGGYFAADGFPTDYSVALIAWLIG